MAVLILIIILVLLIIAHEAGHFIAAKLSGVKVEEFGVGYPPRALTLGKWGDTEYTLNWLPFGGFVKLLEEDGMEMAPRQARRAGSFAAAPKWKQAIILGAGVTANVLCGWLLFTGALMSGVPASVPEGTDGAVLVISGVLPGSPAADAGMRGGDVLVDVSDARGNHAMLTPSDTAQFIRSRGGSDITVSYTRDGVEASTTLVPAHAVLPDVASQPAIGVQLSLIATRQLPIHTALYESALMTYRGLGEVAVGIGTLIGGVFTGSANLSALIGPVGLTSVVGDAAGQGFGQVLGLAAFISINLAIINLIPIPALDGGRLVFVAIEAITRRPIPTLLSQILNTVGFVLVLLLMVSITVHDISKLVS